MKGLNDIKRLLKNRGAEINRKADKLVKKVAMDGVVVAKRKAPAAFGKLRQGINMKTSYHKAEVFSQMPYSVNVEFGTGQKVEIPVDTPDELKKVARQVSGQKYSGDFDDLIDSLKKWARVKGIQQEAVYPIAVTLIETGQEPQPFMRPAYNASRKALLLGLKTLMK